VTHLRFEAELDLRIEPPDGAPPVTGRLLGEDGTLVLSTPQPQRLVQELRLAGAADLRGLRQLAGRLAARGIAVRVDGPDGRVLALGAGAGSPLGLLLTGSRAVGLGSPRAVAPLARGAAREVLRAPAGRPVVGALTAVAALLTGWALGRRRARSRDRPAGPAYAASGGVTGSAAGLSTCSAAKLPAGSTNHRQATAASSDVAPMARKKTVGPANSSSVRYSSAPTLP
jgi:hypothetical protein